MNDLNIPVSKVFSIVTDNGSNFVKAYKEVSIKVLKYDTIEKVDPHEANDNSEEESR